MSSRSSSRARPGNGPDGHVALEVRGLHKRFRGHLSLRSVQALSGVDLEVRRGEIFGFLGPNGAGKTTTIKCILGLVRPDSGTLRLDGLPVGSVEARRRVGYLPELPSFHDYLTCREVLDYHGRLLGLARADRRRRTERWLERVGMASRADRPIRKCSRGMLQRVGLAQALLHDPELAVLDEPMSGLDPIGRRQVRDLILEQRRAGRTVFFSSHILSDAELLCDRVAILAGGRVRASGRLAELVGSGVDGYELVVSGVAPEVLGPDVEVVSSEAGSVCLRLPATADVRTAVESVLAAGGRLESLTPHRQSLEDVFLREIGRPEEAP